MGYPSESSAKKSSENSNQESRSQLKSVIDGCAFRVYGHWVKKGEGQNRAALFENTPRCEVYNLYINSLNR